MNREFDMKGVAKEMKKRVLSLLLTGAVLVGLLSGCGTAKEEKENSSTSQSAQTNQASQDTDTSSAKEDVNEPAEGKTFVVYFSATGTTEKVAGMIADATGGELFELEPVNPYTDADLDWTDSNSRVSKEHDNESERTVELVSTTIDGFQDASVIYVGYPIWWGIAAWPVNEFIKNNDFSGKTVIPFCTSSSSGFGESGKLLEEMAGSGNWLEGERFSSGASAEDIKEWIDSLGI